MPSGSPQTLVLRADPFSTDAPGIALALAARGLSLRAARSVATVLFDEGRAVVALPRLDGLEPLREALGGVAVDAYGPPDRIDVQAIREASGLTQDAFAAAFGLDLATLRNWEQGRSAPDRAARSLLAAIAVDPDAIRAALAKGATPAA